MPPYKTSARLPPGPGPARPSRCGKTPGVPGAEVPLRARGKFPTAPPPPQPLPEAPAPQDPGRSPPDLRSPPGPASSALPGALRSP